MRFPSLKGFAAESSLDVAQLQQRVAEVKTGIDLRLAAMRSGHEKLAASIAHSSSEPVSLKSVAASRRRARGRGKSRIVTGLNQPRRVA